MCKPQWPKGEGAGGGGEWHNKYVAHTYEQHEGTTARRERGGHRHSKPSDGATRPERKLGEGGARRLEYSTEAGDNDKTYNDMPKGTRRRRGKHMPGGSGADDDDHDNGNDGSDTKIRPPRTSRQPNCARHISLAPARIGSMISFSAALPARCMCLANSSRYRPKSPLGAFVMRGCVSSKHYRNTLGQV